MTTSATPPSRSVGNQQPPKVQRRDNVLTELYRSALGKKYLMAISGIVLMAYVLIHMIGNWKLFEGEASLNEYAIWLRELGEPLIPEYGAIWATRVILILAFGVHIIAAAQLTRMNQISRGRSRYAERHYAAVDFAGRTMRWTGVIVGLFVIYHLADLTWGVQAVNPEWEYLEVYNNVVASFANPVSAAVYIVANAALGVHLYHGAWSLFQSMGWNSPRFNHWRRWFAIGFALLIAVGNISMPVAVQLGLVG